MCFILMFIVLAVNTLIYEVAPQYSTFGSQHYIHVHNKVSTALTITAQSVNYVAREYKTACKLARIYVFLYQIKEVILP